MSTIQITKQWQPEPTKNLVENNPVKDGKKLSMYSETKNFNLCATDMMGLSWILFDNIENDVY